MVAACGCVTNVERIRGLKLIDIALAAYCDEHGSYPPAVIYDDAGKPMHSWRVLILPYLGEAELYKKYRFNEPWNSAHNGQLIQQMPDVYKGPETQQENKGITRVLAITGIGTAWCGGQKTFVGSRNVIRISESPNSNVQWTEPRDLTVDELVEICNKKDTPEKERVFVLKMSGVETAPYGKSRTFIESETRMKN